MIVRRIHHDSDTDLADRTNQWLGFEFVGDDDDLRMSWG